MRFFSAVNNVALGCATREQKSAIGRRKRPPRVKPPHSDVLHARLHTGALALERENISKFELDRLGKGFAVTRVVRAS